MRVLGVTKPRNGGAVWYCGKAANQGVNNAMEGFRLRKKASQNPRIKNRLPGGRRGVGGGGGGGKGKVPTRIMEPIEEIQDPQGNLGARSRKMGKK